MAALFWAVSQAARLKPLRGTQANLRVPTLVAVVAGALLLTATPAAAVRTAGYVTKTKDFPASADANAGSTLSCPTGKSIVSGGAFWYVPGVGFASNRLSASLPLNAHVVRFGS